MSVATWSAPIASAAWCLLDGLLIYVVAIGIGYRRSLALAATLLLLAAPAHILWSRTATGPLTIVPIVLVWLWTIGKYERGADWRWLALGGFTLGVGCYTSMPAVVLLPVYLLVTLALVRRGDGGAIRQYAIVLAACLVPAAFGIATLLRDPSLFGEAMRRYGIYDAARLTPLQGVKDFLHYNNVQERVSLYWDYFDPVFLFAAGGADTPSWRAGMLPLAGAIWLPIGIYRMARRRTRIDAVVIAGIVTAPLAAILVDERYVARRELVLLPFATLGAVAGVEYCLSRGGWWRTATAALIAVTAIWAIALWARG